MVLTGLIVLLSISSCAQKQIPPTSTATPTAIATPIPTQALTMPVDGADITCKDAADYYKKGDIALANQAYLAILAKTPLAKCALEGSAMLSELLSPTKTVVPTPTLSPTVTPNAATVVPALIKAGDYSGAYEKAKEGISADPEIQKSLNRDFLNWFVVKNFCVAYVLPLAIILLILIILYLAFSKFRKVYRTVQLDLKEFSSGTYSIDEKVVGALGKSISSRIELVLKRNLDNQPNSVRELVNTPLCLPELPSSVPSQISGFWNFITKLFPPRVLTVEGLLEYNESDGIGLSVKIINERDQLFAGHRLFWAKDINLDYKITGTNEDIKTVNSKSTTETKEEPANKTSIAIKNSVETTSTTQTINDILVYKFFDLADIAAAWIYWEYCEIQQFDMQEIFGTDVFESYLWYSLSCDPAHNEQYLDYSLAEDYKNTLALINKAKNFLNKYRKSKSAITWDQLNENSLKLLHQVIGLRANDIDASKILANYTLGVVYLDKSILDIDPHESIGKLHILPDIESYDGYFGDAYKDINDFLKSNTTKQRRGKPLKHQFIHTVQLPHIGFMIWQNEKETKWFDQFRAIENEPNKTWDILYNLACAYNRFSLSSKNELIEKLVKEFEPTKHYPYQPIADIETEYKINKLSKKALQIALIYFEEACKANPSIAADLRKNPKSDESFKFMQYVFPEEFNRIIGKK